MCAVVRSRSCDSPAAASNKVGHPPVGLEELAGTQVMQVASPREVHLAAVQKLIVFVSEFERVLAKPSRVTVRLDGLLRHAPFARFAFTRRGRKARSFRSTLRSPPMPTQTQTPMPTAALEILVRAHRAASTSSF